MDELNTYGPGGRGRVRTQPAPLPRMLPVDAVDEPAAPGDPIVTRAAHDIGCESRRGGECDCVPRLVEVRRTTARWLGGGA